MPADIVNLNKFRKAKAREEGKKRAEANRAKFGRTKEEMRGEESERARRESLLDGARRPGCDPDDDLDPGTLS